MMLVRERERDVVELLRYQRQIQKVVHEMYNARRVKLVGALEAKCCNDACGCAVMA